MPSHTYYRWDSLTGCWKYLGSGLMAWSQYEYCRNNGICTAVVNHLRDSLRRSLEQVTA